MKNYFATVPTIVPTMNRMQNEMTEDESENLKKSNKKVIPAHGGSMLCLVLYFQDWKQYTCLRGMFSSKTMVLPRKLESWKQIERSGSLNIDAKAKFD